MVGDALELTPFPVLLDTLLGVEDGKVTIRLVIGETVSDSLNEAPWFKASSPIQVPSSVQVDAKR